VERNVSSGGGSIAIAEGVLYEGGDEDLSGW